MRLFLTFISMVLVIGCKSTDSTKAGDTVSAPTKESSTTQQKAEEPNASSDLWQPYKADDLPDLVKRIEPAAFQLFLLNYELMLENLNEPTVVEIPTQLGLTKFTVENANTMSPELAKKFPEIKSLKGKSIDGLLTLRLDLNEKGLFAEISSSKQKQLIAPYLKGSKIYHVLYDESDLENPNPRNESFE